jgi:hypothetical protein
MEDAAEMMHGYGGVYCPNPLNDDTNTDYLDSEEEAKQIESLEIIALKLYHNANDACYNKKLPKEIRQGVYESSLKVLEGFIGLIEHPQDKLFWKFRASRETRALLLERKAEMLAFLGRFDEAVNAGEQANTFYKKGEEKNYLSEQIASWKKGKLSL